MSQGQLVPVRGVETAPGVVFHHGRVKSYLKWRDMRGKAGVKDGVERAAGGRGREVSESRNAQGRSSGGTLLPRKVDGLLGTGAGSAGQRKVPGEARRECTGCLAGE